jgi:hypothetical protein
LKFVEFDQTGADPVVADVLRRGSLSFAASVDGGQPGFKALIHTGASSSGGDL